MLRYAYRSHTGMVRVTNEDALAVKPELGLWVVADGMGGHERGDVASRLTVETVCREVEAGHSATSAIISANHTVLSQPSDNPALAMGTTVVVMRTDAHSFRLAWVGDSRAYHWNGGLRQLSTDHSYVQELVDAGHLNANEAASHPYRSMLTQAIGVSPPDELEIGRVEGPLDPGDGLLLCSDGLTEELSDAAIARCIAATSDPEEVADQLLARTLEAGGRDNVTFIWLSMTD